MRFWISLKRNFPRLICGGAFYCIKQILVKVRYKRRNKLSLNSWIKRARTSKRKFANLQKRTRSSLQTSDNWNKNPWAGWLEILTSPTQMSISYKFWNIINRRKVSGQNRRISIRLSSKYIIDEINLMRFWRKFWITKSQTFAKQIEVHNQTGNQQNQNISTNQTFKKDGQHSKDPSAV